MNYLFDACSEMKLSPKTAQLACVYVDLFLSRRKLSTLHVLELIVLNAISLSLKYEEGRLLSPKKLSQICQGRFTESAFVTGELFVLDTLGWRLDWTTASELLPMLLKIGCEEFDFAYVCTQSANFAALCYADYKLVQQGPLIIATSSACCVLERFKYDSFVQDWLEFLQEKVSLDIFAVRSCVNKIRDKVQSIKDSTLSTRPSDSYDSL
jgi:hypothetical protein